MFQQQMKKYTLEIPHTSQNEYNENVITYSFDREIEMAMCIDNRNKYSGNDTNVLNVNFVGMTRDRLIKKGDKVGGLYIVDFVEVNRLFTIVHMKEIGNNGRF